MQIGPVSTENTIESAISNNAGAVEAHSIDGGLVFRDVLADKAEKIDKPSLSGGMANLDEIFNTAGLRYNIPPDLLKAVAKVESGFNPNVVSKAGAIGIMQLMPGTARGLGVTNPYDPEQNIMGGAKYLRGQLDRFGGDVRLALAAYNAGPGAVTKYGGIPPYKETQNYVPKVLEYYNGGGLIAGMAHYSGFGATGANSLAGSSAFNEAMTQMLLVKIIELQMNMSSDDENKRL